MINRDNIINLNSYIRVSSIKESFEDKCLFVTEPKQLPNVTEYTNVIFETSQLKTRFFEYLELQAIDHTVINSIAFNNKANGFDDNSNPGTITIKNCTAYNNGKRNYSMGRFLEDNDTYNSTWYEGNDLMGPIYNVPKTHHVFENCISYNGGIKDSFSGTAKNCYFYNVNGKYNVFRDLAICNSKYNLGVTYDIFNPFESLNFELNDLENIHYLLRNDDGSINLGLFLKIKNQYSFGANLNN